MTKSNAPGNADIGGNLIKAIDQTMIEIRQQVGDLALDYVIVLSEQGTRDLLAWFRRWWRDTDLIPPVAVAMGDLDSLCLFGAPVTIDQDSPLENGHFRIGLVDKDEPDQET